MTATDANALRSLLVEFARDASTEITVHDDALLPQLRDLLGAGTVVYVAHTPKASIDEVVRTAARVQKAGLNACPHIGARRLRNRAQLEGVLADLRAASVRRMLLIGGDIETPVGDFASARAVLESGMLHASGIESVGVAGYPEGHKRIETASLWRALKRKQRFAERTGMRMHIVSQFGFDPAAVAAWVSELAKHDIRLPVHVGIAGPVPLPKLIRYAVHCGIGASLGAVMKDAGALGNLAAGVGRAAATPDRVLLGVVRARAQRELYQIVKPHFFSLGGPLETARWLRAVGRGEFTLDARDGFAIDPASAA
jgi:methylenetetrahydrofolate reductase (NADPH)